MSEENDLEGYVWARYKMTGEDYTTVYELGRRASHVGFLLGPGQGQGQGQGIGQGLGQGQGQGLGQGYGQGCGQGRIQGWSRRLGHLKKYLIISEILGQNYVYITKNIMRNSEN